LTHPPSVSGAKALVTGGLVAAALLVAFHAMVKVGVDVRVLGARLWDLFYLAAFLLAAYGVGTWVLARIDAPLPAALRGWTQFALGAAAYSLVGMVLAICQLFRGPLLVAMVLMPAAFALREIRPLLRSWREDLVQRRRLVGTSLTVVLLALFLLLALSPPWWIDPLAYQLVTPKEYLAHGGVPDETANILTFLPSAMNILYGFLMAGGSDYLPKLLHFVFLLSSLGVLFEIGRRFLGATVGSLACLLMAAQWEVFQGAQWENVDFHALFFGLLALGLLLLTIGAERAAKSTRLAVLVGLCLGTALASKYTALFTLLGIEAVALFGLVSKKLRLRQLLVLNALALLTFAPTMARNWAFTGDPLFPFLAQRLGAHAVIGPEQLEEWTAERGFAAPRLTVRNVVLLPLLAYVKARFPAVDYDGYWDPFYLLSFPLALLLVRIRPVIGQLFIFLIAFLLGWDTAPTVRYALPAIAVTSLLTAACVELLPQVTWGTTRRARIATHLGRTLIVAFALLQLGHFWTVSGSLLIKGPATFVGLEERRAFLRSTSAGEVVEVNEFLRSRARPGARLFMVLADQSYYLDLPVYADPTRTNLALLRAQKDPVAWLRAHGYHYVLLDEGRHHWIRSQKPVDASFPPYPDAMIRLEESWRYWQQELEPRLRPVRRFGAHVLFEVPAP
jgi:hypothetical protein